MNATQRHQLLQRAVALAEQALEAGDEPFGSVLADAQGVVLREARNRINSGDATQHPEFELARWAAQHLSERERHGATVFTSGEHCPMCAAAHAWAGLGPIVYASSSKQLAAWHKEWELESPPVAPLTIEQVAPKVPVSGPDEALARAVYELHCRYRGARSA
ncbi:nucleoside deaminase [Halomonas sp. PAMB 3264]|uniref:nucleoside deaminase n=1 Tax=Halomonas sp. PAMB 3264 TaxID=3075222 RepID=UPI002898A6FA|nr:nucleoside deaminase [Halomonas sp. PAMB 3264]WNL42886.1 nucleoside deaminase [Halomonas sp. PAMB 3264]